MGLCGGGSSSQSSQPAFPAALKASLVPQLSNLLDPSQSMDSRLSPFVQNAGYNTLAGNQLARTASGAYLDPNDPTAVAWREAMRDTSQQNLGEGLAAMRSRFALSGQNLSGPLMTASQDAIRQNNVGLTNTIAQQEYNRLGQERQLQEQAVGGLQAWNALPSNIYSSLGNLLTGQQSQGSSWNASLC